MKNPLETIFKEKINRIGNKSFSIITLGCKVNQAESEELYSALVELGYSFRSDLNDASIVFINTCAVTSEAEAKTRKAIRKAIRSGAKSVFVLGCASKLVESEFFEFISQSDVELLFLNNSEKMKLIRELKSESMLTNQSKPVKRIRTRAFVKLQDGCNQSCSYCIVPSLRGREVSEDREEILRLLERLQYSGVKEVVLTGVHLGRYRHQKGYGLADLLKDIARNFKFRIRLSSIDVYEITNELIQTMVDFKGRICPHLHVPLQSGSNRILKLMRRPYTAEFYVEKLKEVEKALGLVAFSTDVMVGFPTETESDFQETLNVAEEIGFMRMHIFRYSERPNTEASLLEPKVDACEKKQREKILLDLTEKLGNEFKNKISGKTAFALVEEESKGCFIGKTEYYLDVKILSPVLLNEIYKVKINYVNGELYGEVIQ
ncbi:MAG: tRNA (N(6)-L-threonylcarbamoyladenosine(37)-C(2))-methylthiotransferase MtaB [Actinobacteria bacterium]|nr:tRNA (N(6)-L-threonylcarbamoyladenosine(37)-C(2))-methylthiotransferase MtaB [Actinomycetota bacterium]